MVVNLTWSSLWLEGDQRRGLRRGPVLDHLCLCGRGRGYACCLALCHELSRRLYAVGRLQLLFPVQPVEGGQKGDETGARRTYFLLEKFHFLCFDKLLWNTCITLLCTQAKGPKLLAERCGILLQETRELDLKRLDIGL